MTATMPPLAIQCFNGTTLIAPDNIGPVTAAERSNATSLLLRFKSAPLPVNTTRVVVTLTLTRNGAGTFNDGYADNLSLVLATPDTLLARSAGGATVSDIQSTVDQFRTDLGPLNPNVSGSLSSGRREINWDGVPDNLAAPNNLPANFFNVNSPRGVILSTPGTGFQVSANATNPSFVPVEFGNINSGYPPIFAPFSPQRLFTALGSNVTDVTFFVPGSTTPALVAGFGAVFSDVDLANTTSLQLFDGSGTSLGTFFAPNVSGEGNVFLSRSLPRK